MKTTGTRSPCCRAVFTISKQFARVTPCERATLQIQFVLIHARTNARMHACTNERTNTHLTSMLDDGTIREWIGKRDACRYVRGREEVREEVMYESGGGKGEDRREGDKDKVHGSKAATMTMIFKRNQ